MVWAVTSMPSCSTQVITGADMMSATVMDSTSVPSAARWRTTSRSLTIPSGVRPSVVTTTAPILRRLSRPMSSATVAPGVMVTTSEPLTRIMSAIFML